jgi:hypothetical protein
VLIIRTRNERAWLKAFLQLEFLSHSVCGFSLGKTEFQNNKSNISFRQQSHLMAIAE